MMNRTVYAKLAGDNGTGRSPVMIGAPVGATLASDQGGSGEESPKERVDRLVAHGRISRDAVARAEQLWRERLQAGVPLPDGETIRVTLDDLYHVIVDDRIWRRSERIELALRAVFEVRDAGAGRRLGLSRWEEPGGERLASVIIDSDKTLRALHLIDERRLERYSRQAGEVLWKR